MTWTVETLRTDVGHRHKGGRAQGAAWGPLVCLSAIRGSDPVTGVVPEDPRRQIELCFHNLLDVLAELGSGPSEVVRVGMYMKSIETTRPIVNEVWKSTFGAHSPARFAVEVADLGAPGDPSCLLIEVVAVRALPDSATGSR